MHFSSSSLSLDLVRGARRDVRSSPLTFLVCRAGRDWVTPQFLAGFQRECPDFKRHGTGFLATMQAPSGELVVGSVSGVGAALRLVNGCLTVECVDASPIAVRT